MLIANQESSITPLVKDGEKYWTRGMVQEMYKVSKRVTQKAVAKARLEGRISVGTKMESTANDGKNYKYEVFSIDDGLGSMANFRHTGKDGKNY